MSIDVTSEQLKRLISKEQLPVIVDVWAPWCAPCSYFSPIIDKIANDHKGSAVVVKLNFDDNKDYALSELMVMNIPSVYVFSDGLMVKKITGAHDIDKMLKYLSPFLNTRT